MDLPIHSIFMSSWRRRRNLYFYYSVLFETQGVGCKIKLTQTMNICCSWGEGGGGVVEEQAFLVSVHEVDCGM